ncbi:MAG: branched-chain amino acid aminotransferase [Dehalococcoidia bacterium]|nr:branched-chain amino acid aminotransferase [Dehalococcoidia bacterium]MDD5494064.1 branched-chain amino acid aminotransferase [Dehalococcoidia bacterium]
MEIRKTKKSRIHKVDFSALGFGDVFSDHMLTMDYKSGKWGAPKIKPFGHVHILPSLTTLHYAQAVFEGLKAFIAKDGSIHIFRPDKHIERYNRSCRRLCIPEIDKKTFMDGMVQLIKMEKQWIPTQKGYSLYIRPFVFATDNNLGVHVSQTYKFFIILSPVGAYYKEGMNPVKLITAIEHTRAAEGGTGFAKTPGNYAASLYAAHEAQKQGYTQVLWLDGMQKHYIEEVGTMNVFFYIGDELITPHLGGTILAGVTRDSVIHLARDWGMKVIERKLSMDEVIDAWEKGKLKEAFGTGTAAVISPIGSITHKEKTILINKGRTGQLSQKLYDTITGIQYGENPDKFSWIHKIK